MKRLKPHLALFFCNAIWAVNYPFYHILFSKGISAAAMLELSLLVAALLAFVPLLWSRAEKIARGDIKYLFAAAILSGLMRKGFVIFSLSLTTPIEASIISSLLPVMALLISVAMGIDRFTSSRIIGIILGMVGVVAVIARGGSTGSATCALCGNVLMVLYTVAAGFYMVWLQPMFKKYKPVTLLRWIYLLSSLMFLPFSLDAITKIPLSTLSTHTLILGAVVVALPTFLPNLLLSYALRSVKPTVSSIYSYLQPILAIAVSLWLGVGKLHISTLLFGLIIIAGVTLVIRSYEHKSPKRL
ncbi:MAG: DMT family transporter [Rikenellaceae bacterium]